MIRLLRSLVICSVTIGSLLGSVAAQANLVTNPGFETGDFSGWDSGFSDVFAEAGVDDAAPHGGSVAAYFGNPSDRPGTLSQAITTEAGRTYTISYWLQNEDLGGTGSTGFTAQFGDTTMGFTSGTPFDYTLFSFDVLATTTSTLLSFRFVNEPSLFDFDDVSVELAGPTAGGTVPEPASLALLALAGAIGAVQRRRQARQTDIE